MGAFFAKCNFELIMFDLKTRQEVGNKSWVAEF